MLLHLRVPRPSEPPTLPLHALLTLTPAAALGLPAAPHACVATAQDARLAEARELLADYGPAMIKALGDKDDEVRAVAARALIDPEAHQTYEKGPRDKDGGVRCALYAVAPEG